MHYYGKMQLKSWKHHQGLSRLVHSRAAHYQNFHDYLHSTLLLTLKEYVSSWSEARQCSLEVSWDLRDILNHWFRYNFQSWERFSDNYERHSFSLVCFLWATRPLRCPPFFRHLVYRYYFIYSHEKERTLHLT